MKFNQNNYRRLTHVQAEAIPVPAPVEVGELTPEQSSSFNQKFISLRIQSEIDSQDKLLRRARPRDAKTAREKQLREYQTNG